MWAAVSGCVYYPLWFIPGLLPAGLSSIDIHTEIINLINAVLPVWILWTDMHLQEDPLGESFEALATLPQVPVAEITAQLAGGGRARQDSLVLCPQLAKTGV